MYDKNLTKDLRLRLSETDMSFLRKLSDERGISVSAVIRSIIGDYRRSLDTLEVLTSAIKTIEQANKNEKVKEGGLSNGDTETNINDIL